MDKLVSIILLCLSAGARSETSNDKLKKRGNGNIYSYFGDEFEPVAYAAVPLNQPMPIIRIMSPSFKYKFGSPYDEKGEPTRHYYARQPITSYSPAIIDTRKTELSPSSSELQASEVIYARPNKRGGYTYRRPATARRPSVEPFLIRVHRYKVVRDR